MSPSLRRPRMPRKIPQRNRQPIPRIDRRNRQRQVHRLHVAEVLPHLRHTRHPARAHPEYSSPPRPTPAPPAPAAYTHSEPAPASATPAIRSSGSCIFLSSLRMQTDAVLAPIHQRSPQPHQVQQHRLQPASPCSGSAPAPASCANPSGASLLYSTVPPSKFPPAGDLCRSTPTPVTQS